MQTKKCSYCGKKYAVPHHCEKTGRMEGETEEEKEMSRFDFIIFYRKLKWVENFFAVFIVVSFILGFFYYPFYALALGGMVFLYFLSR